MKLSMITENQDDILSSHRLDIRGAKPIKNPSLTELFDSPNGLTDLKRKFAISRILYNNKTPINTKPDVAGFKKESFGYGDCLPWMVFSNGIVAYILIWKNAKQYWFDTHL